MRTASKKVSCLWMLIIGIPLVLNSCGPAIKGENNNFTKSQVKETVLPKATSKKDKVEIENQKDKSLPNKKSNRFVEPSNWKVYRYSEYGYKVAYPADYSPSISGGHSVLANPEFGMRLSLYAKDNQPSADIDSIKIGAGRSVENFIKSKYGGRQKLVGSFPVNNENHKIYSMKDEAYYFIFFSNGKYLFQLSSPSKEFLTKIAGTFAFI